MKHATPAALDRLDFLFPSQAEASKELC